MEFTADHVRSYLSRVVVFLGCVLAVVIGFAGGIWWGLGVFFASYVIAHIIGDPLKAQKAKIEAHYKQLDAQAPWNLVEFRISTDPASYPVKLTSEQAVHCAYKRARELSVEFIGLRVHITDGAPDSEIPRRMFRQGADYEFRLKKKNIDEPLDAEEQRFMPRLEQLKARCAVDALEGMQIPEAIECVIANEPAHGTTRVEGYAFGMTPCSKYHNERFYERGQLTRRRGWEPAGHIHFSERR